MTMAMDIPHYGILYLRGMVMARQYEAVVILMIDTD